jgi:uncharacterized protein
MTTLQPIIDAEGWHRPRRFAVLSAVAFLGLYVAAVVIGSAVQSALRLPLAMGWFQQLAGFALAIGWARAAGDSVALLGLRRPTVGWWRTVGLATGALVVGGWMASRLLPEETTRYTLEYFLYEASAPGLGEEFGLRGPWLALVLIGTAQHPRGRTWPAAAILLIAALPFAALHLFSVSGLKLAVYGGFTLYAGLILQWVRLRHHSIWPAVAAHNLAKLLPAAVDCTAQHFRF